MKTAPAYAEAAWVLDELAGRRGSLKALVHAPSVTQTRQVYLLVCQTLKYRAALREALARAGVLAAEPRLAARPSAALVLAHDLLLGGGIRGRGSWQQDVKRHAAAIQSAWADVLRRHGARTPEDVLPEEVRNPPWIPRWARVNRLRRSVKDVLARLRESGYTVLPPTTTLDALADTMRTDPGSLPQRWVRVDTVLPDVLAFPPTAILLDDHPDLLQDGSLILQDLASCMPAYALGVDRTVAHAVDACAAPGNKTSCLAALMRNAGRITACDVDGDRLDLLRRLTGRAGAANIEPWHGSFLDLDPADADMADVTHILVDPSCSGSGIVSRRLEDLGMAADDDDDSSNSVPEAEPEPEVEVEVGGSWTDGTDRGRPADERLQALAEFQVAAVLHAMTFPSAVRVSYSTCSVHDEENEDVVARILEAAPHFCLVPALPAWPRSVPGLPLPFSSRSRLKLTRADAGAGAGAAGGSRRGRPKFAGAEMCVRTDPRLDHTIGFFLAVFERRAATEDDGHDHDEALAEPPPKKKKKKDKKRKAHENEADA